MGKHVISLAVLLMAGSTTAAQGVTPVYMFAAADRLPLERPVVLEGILQEGVFLGAPSYGNDPQADVQERWPYLQLPYPVQFERDPTLDTSQTQKDHALYFIQLLLLAEHGGRADLFGRKVRVRGRAMWGHTSHHRTPVVVSVESVARIPSYGLLKKRGSPTTEMKLTSVERIERSQPFSGVGRLVWKWSGI